MDFEQLIEEFKMWNHVSPTFYNKFLNSYTFLYSYFKGTSKRNVSFIVMEKDGKINCISNLSMYNQKTFEDVKNIEELNRIFEIFLHQVMRNKDIKLEKAA